MNASQDEFQQPSTSRKAIKQEKNTHLQSSEDCSDTLFQTVKEEQAEIATLETERKANADAAEDPGDSEKHIKFHCSSCDMLEFVQYYGKKPEFAHGIQFFEDTYVMRDPFKPPASRWKPKPECFIAIGVHCSACSASVCHDSGCSFFYTRTFCLKCAEKQLHTMPPEAQVKLRKQLLSKQTK